MLKRPASLRVLIAALLAASPLFSAAPVFAQPEVAARIEVPAARVAVPSLSTLSLPPSQLPGAALSATAIPSLGAIPTLAAPAGAPAPAALAGSAAAGPSALALPSSALAPQAASVAPQASAAAAQVQISANGANVQAAAAADARSARPTTVLGRLASAVKRGLAASIFEPARSAEGQQAPAFASGIITQPAEQHDLRWGVRLDKKPRRTDEGAVRTRRFHVNAAGDADGGDQPVVLNADPTNADSVEQALMALVDSDPAKYGASSADMAKVHVQLVPGDKTQGQADTYYAIFRQWKKGEDRDGKPYYLLVDGGSLSFVVKVIQGKPVVMATEGRLFPGVDAKIMTPSYSDAQLFNMAKNRLSSPPNQAPAARLKTTLSRLWQAAKRAAGASQESAPEFITRQITNVNGTWRAVNVYSATDLKGRPVIVAVDVNTGDAFAWSAQDLLRAAPAAEKASGVAMARGTTINQEGSDHGPTDAMPLAFANVYDQNGKVVGVTDAEGRFTVPSDAGKLTIRLEGAYAALSDDDSNNAKLQATLDAQPGDTLRAVINATGDDEELDADVNGYLYYSRQVAWLSGPGGITDPRISAPLKGGVRANRTDMPGNAYFSPTDDSLNLQRRATINVKDRAGKKHTLIFENTAQPSIIFHESTHRAVHVLSQIAMTAEQAASSAFRFVARIMDPVMDGGVNEAIADTVSMFMRNSPLIGEGFILNMPAGRPNIIRTGTNTTQFDPQNPDPHAQGEAYMGFTWTVRQGLIQALGQAAGAAYAALVVVPTTLYSQPQDVPTAMLHVLLADMRADGTIPHADMIRKAAADHGPQLPGGPSNAGQ